MCKEYEHVFKKKGKCPGKLGQVCQTAHSEDKTSPAPTVPQLPKCHGPTSKWWFNVTADESSRLVNRDSALSPGLQSTQSVCVTDVTICNFSQSNITAGSFQGLISKPACQQDDMQCPEVDQTADVLLCVCVCALSLASCAASPNDCTGIPSHVKHNPEI